MTNTFRQTISRSLMIKLLGRQSEKALPRKLESEPFAASLQSALPLDEMLQRRLQLQRIVDVSVLGSTRGKKKHILITMKVSLKPDAPHEQLGIFIPSNSSVAHEITITFHNVNQLSKLLAFCVDESVRGCDDKCAFCSSLRTYLSNHWARDPLVAVINMGETVLRKPSLAMHLARLVAFATGTSMAVAAVANDTAGVQLVPQLSPLRQQGKHKDEVACVARNAVAAVVYDFLGIFDQTSTEPSSTTKDL